MANRRWKAGLKGKFRDRIGSPGRKVHRGTLAERPPRGRKRKPRLVAETLCGIVLPTPSKLHYSPVTCKRCLKAERARRG